MRRIRSKMTIKEKKERKRERREEREMKYYSILYYVNKIK